MSEQNLAEIIVNDAIKFVERMAMVDNYGASERHLREVISVGRNGYIDTVSFRGGAKSINEIARLNDYAKAILNEPPTVAAQIIYLVGLDVVSRMAANSDTSNSPESILAKKLIETLDEEKKLNMLRSLQKSMSTQDFVSWCKANPTQSIGYEILLVENSWRNTDFNAPKRYISFLQELLTYPGVTELDKNFIIKKAKEQKLILNANDERNFVVFASRYGMSGGKHNRWQWSEKAQSFYEKHYKQ